MAFKETFRPFLSNLFKAALQQAMEDDVVTPEESLILAQIEVDIRAFEKEIAEQIEDEGVKPTALSKKAFMDQLITRVKKIALEDGTISKDEEALLSKLEEYFS
jgi:hypothetical protein